MPTKLRLAVYRYRYINHPYLAVGEQPCKFVESPQNIHTDPSAQLVVRACGGSSDNHVHWTPRTNLEPLAPFGAAMSSSHGVVTRNHSTHRRGDRIWLRSDLPLTSHHTKDRCPVVNLDKLRSGEVLIRNVRWQPDKVSRNPYQDDPDHEDGDQQRQTTTTRREPAWESYEDAEPSDDDDNDEGAEEHSSVPRPPPPPPRSVLAFAGPEFWYHFRCPGDKYATVQKFRMCIAWTRNQVQDADDKPVDNNDGTFEMVLVEHIERLFDEARPPLSLAAVFAKYMHM